MVFYSFLAVFTLVRKCFAFEIRNLPAKRHSQFPGPELDQSMELGSISNLAVRLLLLAGRLWSVTSHTPSAVHLDTSGRAPRIHADRSVQREIILLVYMSRAAGKNKVPN